MCTLSYGKGIRDTTLNAMTIKFCNTIMNVSTEDYLCVHYLMEKGIKASDTNLNDKGSL